MILLIDNVTENKMNVKQYAVNANGIAQIAEFLKNNHKKIDFNAEQLCAWAADANFQLAEGNAATIELKSWDSVTDHTQEFTVSDDGIDCEIIEIDE